jgi:hypothetical protein
MVMVMIWLHGDGGCGDMVTVMKVIVMKVIVMKVMVIW